MADPLIRAETAPPGPQIKAWRQAMAETPTGAETAPPVQAMAETPMEAMDLNALFAEAVKAVKARTDLSSNDQLQLYSHYKQATSGPVTSKRPGWSDMVGRAKWDAYKALGDMSQDDAKEEYCSQVDIFVPGWRPSAPGSFEKAASKSAVAETPAPEVKSSRRPSKTLASSEVMGFRRFFKRIVGGDPFDHDVQLTTPGEFLPAAHSIADKFLLLCILDSEVQPLYAHAAADLPHLKAHLVEALLTASRSAFASDEGVPHDEPLSLQAHRELSEKHLERLRSHLSTATKEHCESGIEHAAWETAEALSARLLNAHGIPLTLLPTVELGENADQAHALKAKGGDPTARVIAGIEFAPLKVSMSRRRQTFACMIGSTLILQCLVLLLVCIYFWRRTWPLLVPYLTWACYFDKSPFKGGMKVSRWLRRSWLFKNWADYFPATLIKAHPEADFNGTRPMMIGYHPHGILSFGALLNYGTDCTGWAEKFPKLMPRLCTLNMNLRMPFLREIIGRLGGIPASEGSIKKALIPGNAVVLVVGGAAEALDTKPGQYVLTLARRRGFFRLALEHGADLVPSFGFGENDIYETMEPRSLLRTFQLRVYKLMSFSMPIFYGRGVFTYNAGLLPYRRPLTVVVGDPIRVEKTPSPTAEQIEALKAQYIEALRSLFKEWQPRLEPGRNTALIIV